jgi:hypothetical protein
MSLVHTAWLTGRDGKVPINDCRGFLPVVPPTTLDWNHVWTWLEGIEMARPRLEPALAGTLLGRESHRERSQTNCLG